MNGHLYTIVNKINGKEYIGKTYRSLPERFKEHIKLASKGSDRAICRAIRKYGAESFEIYLLDSYPEGELELEEIKAIELYDTFKNGYNSTLGGDGSRYLDETLIIAEYAKELSIIKVATALKIDRKTVSFILKKNNIKTKTSQESKRDSGKKVLYNDTLFNSVSDCADHLINSGLSIVDNQQTQQGIRRVCQGLRKSYLKQTFEYTRA